MSAAVIENNVIANNRTSAGGGGISFCCSDPLFINNTVYENVADQAGGGLYSYGNASPFVVNSIFWSDSSGTGNEIDTTEGSAAILYCDIQGGWDGEGNIDIDPLFRDPGNGDFHLMSAECGDPNDSPCIDAGDPSIFDYLLDCDWGLGYERSDMGAYGGQAIPTDIREEQVPEIPIACRMLQNYPNPFNATTTLTYMLPESGPVTVFAYNLLGQRVATLFEGDQQAGQHSLVWDAAAFPSGVYFARLGAKDYSKSIKMMLLK